MLCNNATNIKCLLYLYDSYYPEYAAQYHMKLNNVVHASIPSTRYVEEARESEVPGHPVQG